MYRLEKYTTLKSPPTVNNEFLANDNQAIQRQRCFGSCLLCGQDVLFAVQHENLRETIICPLCSSYNRQRQLIAVLSLALHGEIVSLKDIVSRLQTGTKILLLESVTNLASALQHYGGSRLEIHATEYISNKLKSGEKGESGITHLNIENTHYPDNFFDIILHAEVFEHVGDAIKAEKEQVRLLKNNGTIVYTAPFTPGLPGDDLRATVSRFGKIKHHKEPVYHEDPAPREDIHTTSGCLVFRTFSYPDLLKRYHAMQADFTCYSLYMPQYGILGNNGFVFSVAKSSKN
jgi:SAM-dependent methyltransferase